MKAERGLSPEMRAFDRAEKMRMKIRRRAMGTDGKMEQAWPALMSRIARADRRLAEARAVVDATQ